jgi:hypothetical protein
VPDEHSELKFGPLRQKYLKKVLHSPPPEKGQVVLGMQGLFKQKNSSSVSCTVFKKSSAAKAAMKKVDFYYLSLHTL